jgi:hypothetical protein
MARKSARPRLHLPTVAKKRSSWEQRSGTSSRAASILYRGFNEAVEFVEDEDGNAVRQWPANMQSYTNEDMKRALSRRRAVERHELLEHVPPTAIGYMQTKGWIQRDPRGGFFYVTRKAWLDLGLPSHDRGGRKIRFHDGI